MHFWRRDYFNSLKDVAVKARKTPQWSEYADFCERYEQGLRNEAFSILARLIFSVERTSFAERRAFVSWLSHECDQRKGRHMLVPHPLQIRVIEPTLLEWTLAEPTCAEPHIWIGGYDHLKLALELEPENQIALRKLVIAVLSRVVFNGHEIPVGYLGNPEGDLAALEEADELLRGLADENDRLNLVADIAEKRKRIRDFSKGD